ncbi:hypothetical protein BOX15_Mlig014564g1, partial [Macrostomum lignano]
VPQCSAIPSVNPLRAIMFGPVNYADAPPELCYRNCPRIYPAAEDSSAPSSTASENSTRRPSASALSDIFLTETGRALYPVRKRPCYLLIRFTKPHCRVLRNFIISCSTRLAVVNGDYCGIATKVFNVKTDAPDPVQSVGLLRFASTEQAYRFVTDERHFSNKEFLGGRFDVWCLSLHSPDRSVMPSPIEPRKLISSMCVFHLVHVRVHAAKPEGMDMTAEALQLAEAEINSPGGQPGSCGPLRRPPGCQGLSWGIGQRDSNPRPAVSESAGRAGQVSVRQPVAGRAPVLAVDGRCGRPGVWPLHRRAGRSRLRVSAVHRLSGLSRRCLN